MKITVQTVGEVILSQRDFVASGGEKDVYAHGDTGYAIYLPGKMIPTAKIKELSVLDHPNIIRPQHLILDKHNKPIGHTMRFIRNAIPFTQIFPKVFKQNHKLTPEKVLAIVKDFQSLVQFVHGKSILIVDLNELNFLLDYDPVSGNGFKEIFAIDVNSYHTPSFPNTVIMPSIRDFHSSYPTETSDWFSWGVVSFQMQIGMHPYKGGNPNFENLPPGERMEARMKKNVSVFNSESTMPGAALPLDLIPTALKQWYIAVFEKGERIPPPKDYEGIVVVTKVKEIVGSNLFVITELGVYDSAVTAVYCSGATRIVQTESGGIYINNRSGKCPAHAKLGFTPKMNKPVILHMQKENNIGITTYSAVVRSLENDEVLYKIAADGIMAYNSRFYIRTGLNVLEVCFIEIGNKVLGAVKTIASVLDLPESTKMFDGVIMQNMAGQYVASIFPESGIHHQIKIPELDGYRLIEAKYENKVLVVVVEKRGKYDRFVFRFDDKHSSYDSRKIEDVDYQGLNFTVADHGVCVMMNEDEKIEAFTNKKDSGAVKIISDPAIDGDVSFFHDGSEVLFAKGAKLYSMTMRK